MVVKSIKQIGVYVNICEDKNGEDHYRSLSPGDDISNEPHQEVKAACEKAWTPEVVEAYRLHLESAV